MTRRWAVLIFVTLLAVSCGTPTAVASAPGTSPSAAVSPSAVASASPSPSPQPRAPAPLPVAPPPVLIYVTFAGLPAGIFPTHLHSRCDGRQSFHITVLNNLAVGADGRGAVPVPTSYFGRGLCVIVYTDASAARVLTFRAI